MYTERWNDKGDAGYWETYPLFITTQDPGIGVFSTSCTDCKAKKKFSSTDARGHALQSKGKATEWVNVFDAAESGL